MSKGLAPLEVSKELKDFVLEFVKNGLDRRFICGSFDLIEKELKEYEQYKAIEDELGIDLVTYFRAKNEGAWYKDINNNICWCDMPSFSKGDIDFNGYHTTTRMYGKIWALTKEELEK